MMPPCSCETPGKNPGTSSNVTSGMLKQSQKRTNLAAFTEPSISRTPARYAGWLATIPTERPAKRAGIYPPPVDLSLALKLCSPSLDVILNVSLLIEQHVRRLAVASAVVVRSAPATRPPLCRTISRLRVWHARGAVRTRRRSSFVRNDDVISPHHLRLLPKLCLLPSSLALASHAFASSAYPFFLATSAALL